MNQALIRSCPKCGSGRVVRNGTRGARQLYLCRNPGCGKRYGEGGAVGGCTYPPEAIGSAIRRFYGGESFGSITSSITPTLKTPGSKTSAETIRRWVTKYSPALIGKWLDEPPDPGLWGYWRRWSVHHWTGCRPIHWVVVMDDDSRYILACSARKGGRIAALREAIILARERSGILNGTTFLMRFVHSNPRNRVGRSWSEIERVFSHELGMWIWEQPGVGSTFSGDSSALDLEPLTLGPFPKGASWIAEEDTAQLYLEGWAANYNYFQPQSELHDRTPSEVVGLVSPYDDWVDLVRKQYED